MLASLALSASHLHSFSFSFKKSRSSSPGAPANKGRRLWEVGRPRFNNEVLPAFAVGVDFFNLIYVNINIMPAWFLRGLSTWEQLPDTPAPGRGRIFRVDAGSQAVTNASLMNHIQTRWLPRSDCSVFLGAMKPSVSARNALQTVTAARGQGMLSTGTRLQLYSCLGATAGAYLCRGLRRESRVGFFSLATTVTERHATFLSVHLRNWWEPTTTVFEIDCPFDDVMTVPQRLYNLPLGNGRYMPTGEEEYMTAMFEADNPLEAFTASGALAPVPLQLAAYQELFYALDHSSQGLGFHNNQGVFSWRSLVREEFPFTWWHDEYHIGRYLFASNSVAVRIRPDLQRASIPDGWVQCGRLD